MFLGLTERELDPDEYHGGHEGVGPSRPLAYNHLPYFFGEGKAMG
jgi:hypothetical protein